MDDWQIKEFAFNNLFSDKEQLIMMFQKNIIMKDVLKKLKEQQEKTFTRELLIEKTNKSNNSTKFKPGDWTIDL